MNDLTLTTEEAAHIRARRQQAVDDEKKRLAEERAFDLDQIRPGMTKEEEAKAIAAIQKTGWGGRSR